MKFRLLLLMCLSLITLNVHAKKKHQKVEKGKASFYADKFEGKRTASGELYFHNKLTAAHRSLPFGTLVEVTNLDNKKVVIVRINDRGPFSARRIIDLSKSAAKTIGNLRQGIFSVSVKVYKKNQKTSRKKRKKKSATRR